MNLFTSKQLGLAIRPDVVELVETSRNTLTHTARIPIKGKGDTVVLDAIRSIVKVAKLKGRQVAVSISNKDILLRFFMLPMLPKSERESAIKFEARKHIPFRTEDLVWDYHVLEDRASKQLGVIFAGIRKDRFDLVKKWIFQAGLEASTIEPQNVSMARLVAAAYPESRGKFVGVVELDEETFTAHIAIVKDQLPYLARDVALAEHAEAEEEQQQQQQQVPPATPSGESIWVAGQLTVDLPQPAAGSAPDAQSAEADDHRQERLLSELRLSLDFFTREYPAASISRLLIYGGKAEVASWCRGLAEQLHCPVQVGSLPLTGSSVSMDKIAASSIGVAIQMRGGGKLDLLERSKGKQPGPVIDARVQMESAYNKGIEMVHAVKIMDFVRTIVKPLVVQGIVAAVALVLVTQLSQRRVTEVQAELEQVQGGETESAVAEIIRGRDEQALGELQRTLNLNIWKLERIVENRISVTEKLTALADALPDGFWLEGIEYRHRVNQDFEGDVTLTINGACYLPNRMGEEFLVIGEFSDKIKADPRFFRGFAVSQLGKIVSAEDATTHLSYRAFTLSCNSKRDRR